MTQSVQQAPHLKIGIAGGGLLGRLSAWRLALKGHHVTLFEAATFSQPKGACWTAAGMISPLSEVVHSDCAVYELGELSQQIWPLWIDQLETSQNRKLNYRQAGSIVVAHPQDLIELEQFRRDLKHKVKGIEGFDQSKHLADLSSAEIKTLEPSLAHFNQALYLKSESDLDNRAVLRALLDELQKLKVTLVENTPVSCNPFEIRADAIRHAFDLVLDVRGMGAKEQLTDLRGVRGEVMLVETSEITLQRPVRMMHPRYKLYVVPKPNHQFVIGATEIESDDMSPMSLQSNLELSSALYTLNPAFSEARILEQGVNCRPALMNNLPKVTSNEGLITANGLYRHGYLLAPAVVQEILNKVDPLNTSSLITQVA